MCLAIPGRVVDLPADRPNFAVIEVSDVRRTVNIDLVKDDGLAPGDWVLIHVGFAMSRISEEEAAEQLRLLALMGDAALADEELKGYRFE